MWAHCLLYQGKSLAVFQMSGVVMRSRASLTSSVSSHLSWMTLLSWPAEMGCSHLCLPWPPLPMGCKRTMMWSSWTAGPLTGWWTFRSFCKSWIVWSPLGPQASFTSSVCTLDNLASQPGELMELWQEAEKAYHLSCRSFRLQKQIL